MELVISLKDDLETQELGEHLSKVCKNGITIYLEGDLGAGKTTLSKGFIRARGYNGIVKSPTYTLVESYSFSDTTIYHFDLYRLMDPEELELMGIRDYFGDNSIRLVEWPKQGEGVLPQCDLIVNIIYSNEMRIAKIIPNSELGKNIVGEINLIYNG